MQDKAGSKCTIRLAKLLYRTATSLDGQICGQTTEKTAASRRLPHHDILRLEGYTRIGIEKDPAPWQSSRGTASVSCHDRQAIPVTKPSVIPRLMSDQPASLCSLSTRVVSRSKRVVIQALRLSLLAAATTASRRHKSLHPDRQLAKPGLLRFCPFLCVPGEALFHRVLELLAQFVRHAAVEIDDILDSDDAIMESIGLVSPRTVYTDLNGLICRK
jgi:hypothetical protein